MRANVFRSHAWQVSIGRFVVLLALALAVGAAIGHVRDALLVALGLYVAHSFWSLYRLQSWLRSARRQAPPEDLGVWSDMSDFVFRRLNSERSRKRRLVTLLRAFREAAAALPDGVVVLNPARGIVWFNESAGRLLRLSLRHDRGRFIEDYLPQPAVRAWLRDAAPGEPLTDIGAAHDDSLRLSLRLIPYERDQTLLIVRDISNLMRLEHMRRDFVANVSHELRTPLTVLHGYLDMLEPEDAPQWAPMLGDLRSQSKRMAQIVEDLLTLSRLEAQQDVADERVAMRAMLNTLKREAEALSQGRHAIDIDVGAECDVRGSTQYLHSAFSNLVSNAVRYTPTGGRITIGWASDGKNGRFSVTDTGYGIPAEHIPRITERFYRVSTSRSRATGGTGLGLAIVKHVLNLHQARLEIASETGVGSTFTTVFGADRLIPTAALAEAAP